MLTTMSERDDFREAVFARDRHLGVVCRSPAVDAHHLIERRLFADGGYLADNGVSLCAGCHLQAEQTLFAPDELRERAGITDRVLPPSLYPAAIYDKWGNLTDPERARGPLFEQDPVQRARPGRPARSLSA